MFEFVSAALDLREEHSAQRGYWLGVAPWRRLRTARLSGRGVLLYDRSLPTWVNDSVDRLERPKNHHALQRDIGSG